MEPCSKVSAEGLETNLFPRTASWSLERIPCEIRESNAHIALDGEFRENIVPKEQQKRVGVQYI